MTTIETTEARQTTHKNWLRRTVMGATFAAVGLMSLGAATTPAQAYWYGYGYYHPYYHYGWYHYHPTYYGWGYGPRWHHWRHW